MAEIHSIELQGRTRSDWLALHPRARQDILSLWFVDRFSSARIYIKSKIDEDDIRFALEAELRRIIGGNPSYQYIYHADPVQHRLRQAIRNKDSFRDLDFGGDVAETDHHLSEYFVSTDAYQKCRNGDASVVIGPKGSGKSAIMLALSKSADIGWSIVITPEIFATSVLKTFVEDHSGLWDEQEAFVSTWIFTILVEVFRQVCNRPRARNRGALRRIREFLRKNTQYNDVDLFTRFITRLSRIEALKVGELEISLKTRELQKLYSLEDVYALVPDLRKALDQDIVVLIDELDQGWDNSDHSNRFVSALMQAAMRVQGLAMRVRVVAFLRSEIFDLVAKQLVHLDKLRSRIEHLSWSHNALAALILRRVAFSSRITLTNAEPEWISYLLPEAADGMSGFQYLLSRTTMRPREVLQYIRLAHSISVSLGSDTISRRALLSAEDQFSEWKLDHLCAEYRYIYPELGVVLTAFRGIGPSVSRETLVATIEDVAGDIDAFADGTPNWLSRRPGAIIQVLYNVGFVGFRRGKPKRGGSGFMRDYEFSYERPSMRVARLASFVVHPAFWSTLELVSNHRQ